MKDARMVYEEFIALAFRDADVAAEMFTEDGVFEIPYLAAFGIPPRYTGHKEIADFFRFVRRLYPNFYFENFIIRIETPITVSAEYEFRDDSAVTGRPIHQLFFGYLEAENGKIKRLREGFNSLEVIRGLIKEVAGDPKLVQAVEAGAPEYPTEPTH